jgi:peptidoglycan/xylan/chitin deacetylase (PgdA/CDA1 family)
MILTSLKQRANAISRSTFGNIPLEFWQRVFPKDVIALCYHMVSDEVLSHFQLLPFKTAEQFEADVVFARKSAITYGQLADHRLRNQRIPRNSILFTFDDGFAECFTVIRPILKKHQVDGVFFVATDFLDDAASFFECRLSMCISRARALEAERIDPIINELRIDAAAPARNPERHRAALDRLKALRLQTDDHPRRRALYLWLLSLGVDDRREMERACAVLQAYPTKANDRSSIFMSRAQVKQLSMEGFTIGAHGLNHRRLENRDPEGLEHEIVSCCEVVREVTGQERVPFAFPYGGLGVKREVLADILRRNPLVELVFDSGSLRRDPRFVVNRVFADDPPLEASTNVPTALQQSWCIPSAWHRA